MADEAPAPKPSAKQYLFGELQRAQALAADLIDEMAAQAAVAAARIAELEAALAEARKPKTKKAG